LRAGTDDEAADEVLGGIAIILGELIEDVD